MRQRSKTNEGSEEEAEILDTQEQEKIVADIMAQAERDSQRYRLIFGGIAALLGVFYVWFLTSFLMAPWELRHHAEFRTNVTSDMIAINDGMAALSLFLGRFPCTG